MDFFVQAIGSLSTIVTGLGAAVACMGIMGLLEGYGNDNPGSKSQGIKQLVAGGGIAIVGMVLVPLLANVLS